MSTPSYICLVRTWSHLLTDRQATCLAVRFRYSMHSPGSHSADAPFAGNNGAGGGGFLCSATLGLLCSVCEPSGSLRHGLTPTNRQPAPPPAQPVYYPQAQPYQNYQPYGGQPNYCSNILFTILQAGADFRRSCRWRPARWFVVASGELHRGTDRSPHSRTLEEV